MDALKRAGPIGDVDHFLDWREIGVAAVREALDQSFSWPDESPETEYDMLGDVSREIRSRWHPLANQFYLYWRMKRDAAGGAPDRADIDPMLEIPLLCPHVCIFEPAQNVEERPDWFCRLMGTHVEQALGISLTGRRVSEHYPNPSAEQIRRYGRVIHHHLVSHRSGPSRTRVEERVGRVESLYVPITDRRRGTQAAFGMAVYQWLPV